ncbi:4-(cytidine 5'-diphospho)-2-C-methyl-D-erythritol kinase [Buchnera aphidicola (Brachycaudus cardui)]|uniref:4-diphosphocytidyl-2-C-methyl-D-erythritol kinase n=1 Tax=Buchnera aphidicola (Brachycaudus cardui) TaxID=557993 RepID=A0A4D6XU66_9GAMM|nr:4-(cytidine 5'-diphospho)-2-C-methyl-D-erythritol kinase [Buchnera aphidicola]QCI20323.1 4-(cytidine 5'-diphospho)-2-C-methyl-D-erythritol kinase [Buchnera aphidicola (Brachycaudus cardui)]
MIYTWPSPAKINLFLYVTGIRLDGYHYIQTLFQILNYGDTLTIVPNKTSHVQLFTRKQSLINIKNSIIHAAQILKEQALLYGKIHNTNFGAKIFLKKRIPLGSGLGGASSNAATTFIALNQLWNTQFTLEELSVFGLKIGTDVPGFIMGHTAVIEGIGEILYPITQKEKWYLVVYPNIQILTKNMFSNPLLKSNSTKKPIKILLKMPFKNDFQDLVIQKFIHIKQLLSILSTYAPSRMSGTGSCIFSEFSDKKSAQKILALIPKNMKGFISKSVNISPLHNMLYKKNILFIN